MSPWNILAYLGLLTVGGFTLWLAFRLYTRFPLRPFFLYFVSLCGFMALGCFKILGNFTIQEILFRQTAPLSSGHAVYWILRLLSLPCALLAIYAFTSSLLHWTGKRIGKWGKAAFLLLYGGLGIVYFMVGNRELVSGNRRFSSVFFRFDTVVDGMQTGLLVTVLLFTLSRLSKPVASYQKGIRDFILIYILLFIAGFLVVGVFSSERGGCVTEPLFVFFTHLPPLVFLAADWRRHFGKNKTAPVLSGALEQIRTRYRISERELEVIGLLVRGKSYREMEAELFISLKTVKSHVYNIYKKMGIKSRWQLLALLQEEKRPAGGADLPDTTGV